ncbi:MAG: hypothetical protein ACRDZ7_10930 [Acidimicrobiia bacterium]
MGDFLAKLNPNVFFFGMFVVIGVGFLISMWFLKDKSDKSD